MGGADERQPGPSIQRVQQHKVDKEYKSLQCGREAKEIREHDAQVQIAAEAKDPGEAEKKEQENRES